MMMEPDDSNKENLDISLEAIVEKSLKINIIENSRHLFSWWAGIRWVPIKYIEQV